MDLRSSRSWRDAARGGRRPYFPGAPGQRTAGCRPAEEGRCSSRQERATGRRPASGEERSRPMKRISIATAGPRAASGAARYRPEATLERVARLEPEAVLRELATTLDGLPGSEAAARLQQLGPNELERSGRTRRAVLLGQL